MLSLSRLPSTDGPRVATSGILLHTPRGHPSHDPTVPDDLPVRNWPTPVSEGHMSSLSVPAGRVAAWHTPTVYHGPEPGARPARATRSADVGTAGPEAPPAICASVSGGGLRFPSEAGAAATGTTDQISREHAVSKFSTTAEL